MALEVRSWKPASRLMASGTGFLALIRPYVALSEAVHFHSRPLSVSLGANQSTLCRGLQPACTVRPAH